MKLVSAKTSWGKVLRFHIREETADADLVRCCVSGDDYRIRYFGVPGKLFVDVGAYIGPVTVAAASKGMRCIAVECLPENAALIEQNVILNGYQGVVSVVQKAIHDVSGEEVKAFYAPNDTAAMRRHRFIGNTHVDRKNDNYVTVPTVCLDDLVTEDVHVLKIDCEGAEWKMLEGATPSTLDRITFFIGEFHPTGRTWDEFMSLLHGKFRDVSKTYGYVPRIGNTYGPKSPRHFALVHI